MALQGRKVYRYQPLPKQQGYLRLLQLDEGATKPVTGHLTVVSLSNAPAFHALSYAWGTKKQTTAILIDGAAFFVTPNLAAGLLEIASQPMHGEDTAANARLDESESTSDLSVARYIWCDQICVDQENLEERGHQVQQMHRVYLASERTIVWLGIDDGFATGAVHLLRRIENGADDLPSKGELNIAPRRRKVYLGRGFIDWDLHRRQNLPLTVSEAWKNMDKLFSLPWFRRVWIIQEVVLSRRDPLLIVGNVRYSWTKMALAAHWLYLHGYQDGYVSRSIASIHTLLHMRLNKFQYDIGALLRTAIYHNATDPRDNIYGVLGLEMFVQTPADGSLIQPSGIVPDYSLPAAVVYRTAIQQIITVSGSLAILSLPTFRAPWSFDPYECFGRQAWWTGFPSWVPHLEHTPHARSLVGVVPCSDSQQAEFWSLRHPGHSNFRASSGLPVRSESTRPSSRVLTLQGLCVDRVKVCLQVTPLGSLSRQNRSPVVVHGLTTLARIWYYIESRRHYWGFFRTILYLLCMFWTARHRPAAQGMWRTALKHSRYNEPLRVATAVLDATTAGMDSGEQPWDSAGLHHYATFMAHLETYWPTTGLSDSERMAKRTLLDFACSSTQGDGEKYSIAMQYWCNLRRFFVTEQGYVGIGPTSMRKGDDVCVLFGGSVPYILRTSKKGTYHFIGDSYVHELGQGQAVQAMKRGELHEQVFRIN